VVVSGTAPVLPDGDCSESAGEQAARCIEIIAEALAEAGASLEDVVRTRQYIRDRADAEAVSNAHRACFSGVRPASTMILVAGFLDPRWRVEIEAEAVVAD
jgi:enamine deaminase RidA (YjgF/YER057c/UK114 family)